ncbi:MAG TPA: AMP-binding protein [Acidimicrobiales bacterium]
MAAVDGVRVWRITAADGEAMQRRVAASLRRRGLRAGDRVLLSVGTSPALLAAILGSLRSGVVPVVLNPALVPAERAALVADADPALVVDGDGALAALADGDDGYGDGGELAPFPLARPMHYTSGTTGRPKGVWSGVLDEAGAQAMFDDEGAVWSFSAADTVLVCSPLHHSAPIRFAAGVLLRGGAVVLVERFEPGAVRAAVEEHRPTVGFMVPSHLQRVFADGADGERGAERAGDAFDPSSFRLLAHAGEPCAPALKRRVIDAFPAGAVWEFYGSTEGQFTVCSPDEWIARPGTVGRARPGRVLTVDDGGQIWCRVPEWARFEYWRDAEKTAAAWRGDAFTVGDVGRIDDDGFLYLDGRRDDLIISGGVNVYPAEVEAALAGVGGVGELAAFGAPDDRWGQRVCVAVVGTYDEVALRAAARERLAPYKRPKDVYRIDELPRTGTGKVRRSAIAAALGLV